MLKKITFLLLLAISFKTQNMEKSDPADKEKEHRIVNSLSDHDEQRFGLTLTEQKDEKDNKKRKKYKDYKDAKVKIIKNVSADMIAGGKITFKKCSDEQLSESKKKKIISKAIMYKKSKKKSEKKSKPKKRNYTSYVHQSNNKAAVISSRNIDIINGIPNDASSSESSDSSSESESTSDSSSN